MLANLLVLSQAAATFTTLTASIDQNFYGVRSSAFPPLPPPTLTLTLTLTRVRNPNPNPNHQQQRVGIGTQASSALVLPPRRTPVRPKESEEESRAKTERRVRRVAFTTLKQRWDFLPWPAAFATHVAWPRRRRCRRPNLSAALAH